MACLAVDQGQIERCVEDAELDDVTLLKKKYGTLVSIEEEEE